MRFATRRLAAWVAVCALGAPASGIERNPGTPRLAPGEYPLIRERADALVGSDAAGAAALYERLAAASPDDHRIWRALGFCRLEEKKYRQAAQAFERAFELTARRDPEDLYSVARAQALAGDREAAVRALEGALAAGFERRTEISRDPAFAALAGDPAFARAAGQPPSPRPDRVQAWRYDLDYLLAEVRRVHYLYRARPLPASFERAAADLRQRLPRLSDEEIAVALQGMLARLGDGHSALYFFFGPHALTQIPLLLYQFCDGLYVLDAPGRERLVGGRVLSIGTLAADDALARVAPYVSQDQPLFVRAMGPVMLTMPAFLEAIGAVADPRRVPLEIATRDGGRETVELAPGPGGRVAKYLAPSPLPGAAPVPLYQRRAGEPYWFEPLADLPSTVYFQFNQVTNAPRESLAEFALRLRRELDTAGTRNLIVDVRHNPGGNGKLIVPLLRTLIHFETARPEAKLFVLTSRSTYSAAQIFISQVGHLTHALFVGEPSGSSPNFVGEDTPFVLPYSGFAGSVSSRFHQSEDTDFRSWIAPDIPVPVCSADYFANRDPALDAVREVLAGGTAGKARI